MAGQPLPRSLNATIAAHMVGLARPRPGGRALNLCGAGTLAIEHLLADPAGSAVGVDLDGRRALPAAVANAAAAGVARRLSLVRADTTRLPLPAGVGPGALRRPALRRQGPGDHATRGAVRRACWPRRPGGATAARLVAVTEDIARFERAVRDSRSWRVAERQRVFQSGHRPQITRLVRA